MIIIVPFHSIKFLVNLIHIHFVCWYQKLVNFNIFLIPRLIFNLLLILQVGFNIFLIPRVDFTIILTLMIELWTYRIAKIILFRSFRFIYPFPIIIFIIWWILSLFVKFYYVSLHWEPKFAPFLVYTFASLNNSDQVIV